MPPAKFVYWFRFFLAIIVAFLCFLLKLKGFLGILLAILLYLFSCIFVKYGLKLGEKELKGKYKFISIGIGIFIMTWALVWIILYTLFPY
jgi:hypothetical protein